MKRKLIEMEGGIGKSITTVGDFNTHFSVVNRTKSIDTQ